MVTGVLLSVRRVWHLMLVLVAGAMLASCGGGTSIVQGTGKITASGPLPFETPEYSGSGKLLATDDGGVITLLQQDDFFAVKVNSTLAANDWLFTVETDDDEVTMNPEHAVVRNNELHVPGVEMTDDDKYKAFVLKSNAATGDQTGSATLFSVHEDNVLDEVGEEIVDGLHFALSHGGNVLACYYYTGEEENPKLVVNAYDAGYKRIGKERVYPYSEGQSVFGVDVDDDGNVYVATFDETTVRMTKMGADGTPQTVSGKTRFGEEIDDDLSGWALMTIDGKGNLYTAIRHFNGVDDYVSGMSVMKAGFSASAKLAYNTYFEMGPGMFRRIMTDDDGDPRDDFEGWLKKMLVDEGTGTLYVLTDEVWFRGYWQRSFDNQVYITEYHSEDAIVAAFDKEGKAIWHRAIDRLERETGASKNIAHSVSANVTRSGGLQILTQNGEQLQVYEWKQDGTEVSTDTQKRLVMYEGDAHHLGSLTLPLTEGTVICVVQHGDGEDESTMYKLTID